MESIDKIINDMSPKEKWIGVWTIIGFIGNPGIGILAIAISLIGDLMQKKSEDSSKSSKGS